MHDAFWNRKPLSGCELYRPAFQVDDETALDHVEELVLRVVLVPVELALHDTESHDAIVYSGEGLVVPGVLAGIGERLNVDELQGSVAYVQVDRVRRLTAHIWPPW